MILEKPKRRDSLGEDDDAFVMPLVADLRLDNRGELAALLQIPTEKASRFSDAVILLAAIERWGEHCVEKLVGDFAFALWDNEKHCLFDK